MRRQKKGNKCSEKFKRNGQKEENQAGGKSALTKRPGYSIRTVSQLHPGGHPEKGLQYKKKGRPIYTLSDGQVDGQGRKGE